MAIEVVEIPGSRRQTVNRDTGRPETAELLYKCSGTTDELVVRLTMDTALPAVYEGLRLSTYDLDQDTDVPDLWNIVAKYTIPTQSESPPMGAPVAFSFSTVGGTQNIKTSLATMRRLDCTDPNAGAGNIPDYNGSINVGEDGVDGVDIYTPQFEFGYTYDVYSAAIDFPIISYMTGKVNSVPWKSFLAGEVLFLGAEGSGEVNSKSKITFKFSAKPNQYDVVVGDSREFTKDGWDYLWVTFDKDTDNGRVVMKPKYAYVERVYERDDFHSLGV